VLEVTAELGRFEAAPPHALAAIAKKINSAPKKAFCLVIINIPSIFLNSKL
jgi:hypothetical protein